MAGEHPLIRRIREKIAASGAIDIFERIDVVEATQRESGRLVQVRLTGRRWPDRREEAEDSPIVGLEWDIIAEAEEAGELRGEHWEPILWDDGQVEADNRFAGFKTTQQVPREARLNPQEVTQEEPPDEPDRPPRLITFMAWQEFTHHTDEPVTTVSRSLYQAPNALDESMRRTGEQG